MLSALLLLPSCGGVVSVGAGFGHDDYYDGYYNDPWLRNGDRRGDYVFWNGRWHYQGIGTPYDIYWYDPWYDWHWYD